MAVRLDSVKDLRNLDKEVRRVITKHLQETGLTPTGFAKEVGIHPLQMLRYINEGKNFRFETLKVIGSKAKIKKV